MKLELVDRNQSLDCILAGDRETYQKHKKEIEDSLINMEDILQKNKENLEKKYQSRKQSASESLKELEALTIRDIQKKITSLDYGNILEKYVDNVEKILKNGFLNLQENYLSYFESMLKDNKEQLYHQLANCSFYMQMDCEIPENLREAGNQTREIEEKLILPNELKDQLDYELTENSNMQNLTGVERETLLAEQEALKTALENIQEELQEYPPYIEQYYEVQAATHDGEKNMRMLGQLLDVATILIPGGVWANAGAKIIIEHYFAKLGKKFDKPQILQIDHEYEKKCNEGRQEIEQRLYNQAEAEFKKRQELLDIEDKQEQLKLKYEIRFTCNPIIARGCMRRNRCTY